MQEQTNLTTQALLQGMMKILAPSQQQGIYQQSGCNAVDVAKRLEAKLEEPKKDFPSGLELATVPYTVTFIEESTKEVFVTLIKAIALVTLVIFVFLQD